jgi:hypothetical protein
MKLTLILGMGMAAGLSASSVTYGEPVELNQVPPAAQQRINALRVGATIVSVQRTIWDGKSIYDARLNRFGPTNHLYVTGSGAVIDWQSLAARLPLAGVTNVSFGELPMPVLSAIQSYAGAAFISNIVRGDVQGRTVYEVSFLFRGRPVNLRILENGLLVSDRANDLFVAQYKSDLGLPPSPGQGAVPNGESHSGSGSSEPASSPASPARP